MSDNGNTTPNPEIDPRHPSVWSKENDDRVNPIDELAKAAEQFDELSKKFFTLFLHMENCTKEGAQLSKDMSTLLNDINKKIEGAG